MLTKNKNPVTRSENKSLKQTTQATLVTYIDYLNMFGFQKD